MATTAPPERLTREQMAERIKPVLTHTAQTASDIARAAGVIEPEAKLHPNNIVHRSLAVLEARGEAKRLSRGRWVAADAPSTPDPIPSQGIEFPYEFRIVPLADMFVDKNYQRPLTTFVERISVNFDPVLFGTLCLSERKPQNGGGAALHAIIDGQTRWVAARRCGVAEAPCIVYRGMTPQDEARTFARLQKERRGMTSWYRFRAELAAGSERALAIRDIVESAGYTLGDAEGELSAVAALEKCYEVDSFLLERTLVALRAAFPPPARAPERPHITGLHLFFRNPAGKYHSKTEIDDERLVRRMTAAGHDGLKRKASAMRQLMLESGEAKNVQDSAVPMARAIQSIYSGRS